MPGGVMATRVVLDHEFGVRVPAGQPNVKKKGVKEKTQIFVEPKIKRLAFDQKDLHPTDIFTKLEATFSDGTKASQTKTNK